MKTLGSLCLWFAMLSSSINVMDVTVLQKDLVLTKAGIRVIHISVCCTFIFQTAHCTSTVSVFIKNNCCSPYENI